MWCPLRDYSTFLSSLPYLLVSQNNPSRSRLFQWSFLVTSSSYLSSVTPSMERPCRFCFSLQTPHPQKTRVLSDDYVFLFFPIGHLHSSAFYLPSYCGLGPLTPVTGDLSPLTGKLLVFATLADRLPSQTGSVQTGCRRRQFRGRNFISLSPFLDCHQPISSVVRVFVFFLLYFLGLFIQLIFSHKLVSTFTPASSLPSILHL
jgi:hypothetical protein